MTHVVQRDTGRLFPATMTFVACLALAGCPAQDIGAVDASYEGPGYYTSCCEAGVATSCFCPVGRCDYQAYCIEQDGTCRTDMLPRGTDHACDGGMPDLGSPDSGVPDSGG